MAIISIDPRDPTPIYAQLERALRAAIATAKVAPGDQLPTVRQLSVDLQVNANTVARVYASLERAGVIETKRGVGSFISAAPAQAHPPREHERRLRAFTTRLLAEAADHGFTADDVIAALRTHRKGGAEMPAGLTLSMKSRKYDPVDGPSVNGVALAVLLVCLGAGAAGTIGSGSPVPLVVMAIVGVVLMQSPRVASQWERAVILRLGRFVGLRGPGLFWIVPFIDTVSSRIDQRTITTSFAAEQTLTSDTVPVNVDAVLFWMVHDVQKAALEVQDYYQAVSWAAQTALRDIIGRTTLTDLLRGRERIEGELQQLIDARSNPWGVTVSSVEMRDVVIPGALQDAMSREAQAAREKQARIILGEAELAIAHSFQEAAKAYHENPTALHLRAMNMLYEGLKEKGALMLVPSSAVESMGMGGLMGAAALRQQTLAGGDADGQKKE